MMVIKEDQLQWFTRGLASMVYKFFDKKSAEIGVATEPNYQLAN